MATRFYFCRTTSGPAAPVVVATSALWTHSVISSAFQRALQRKGFVGPITTVGTVTGTISTTASEDDCHAQFVSEPIPRQTIGGTISLVIAGLESAIANNISLAMLARVVSQDGSIERGVLLQNFNIDIEWGTTQATRILSAAAITPLLIEYGDRIVIEIGDHHVAGTTGTSAAIAYGTSSATDFALTSGLTTNLNPWVEFSQDLFAGLPNNYQFIDAPGMSTSGRIR